MGQLIEMARFREPEEPKVKAICMQCDADLYEGQFVLEVDRGQYTCDADCYVAWVNPKQEQL